VAGVSRQLRIVYPGALYHLTSRGNERKDIYREPVDRSIFLELLGSVVERFSWLCHSYCEMGNHYHLLVETPKPNLVEGMQRLNGCYAQGCNRRWGRVGHLFQGRYNAILVEKETYLLELVRYISLNPVRAGMFERPERWRWSSYRAYLGLAPRPAWLTTDWVLAQFAPKRARARERLHEFVLEGISTPASLPIRGELFLGSDAFVARHTPAERIPEISRPQWQPLRPPLDEILREHRDPLHAARAHGYTLREIGERTGRHYSTISRRLSNNPKAA